MPAWWDKISGRGKVSETKSEDSVEGSSLKNEKKRGKENGSTKNGKVKSFEEVSVLPQSRNSPRNSWDFSALGRSSGFSGFDSASSWNWGHPLPLPLEPPSEQPGHFHAVGLGPGWGSVSSVSSFGSSDDPAHFADQNGFRGHVENRVLSPLSRSPGRGSRCITTATSPIHARINGITLDSSNGKLEDGRNEFHKLPLPPGSPVSPSALSTPRSPGTPESPSRGGISSKWRKGKLLGRGAFGHVYLGFSSENGQMCAIKEVKVISGEQSSRENVKQLNQEIALLSQLSHPNIVQYYGSDLNEERLSVYLEFVSGGSIHKLLQEYGAFGEPVIQNYTRQILSGLAYLHGRNTVHRDIKGANILVDPNGEIKLADFGMAKHITTRSSTLSFKGSPFWMAPEVVMNTNGYSLPVDIWSLGCTVLEMATSKPPWSQYEWVAAIFKIVNSRDPPEIPDHLSADAKSFIRLCLQREPSARPTASQLLGHPFVRNQATLRATNVKLTREAFPRAFDGSRTQTVLEMQSSRTNNSLDQDDASRFAGPSSSTSPRDNARTIASSLPVSPPSSPLRRDASAYNKVFLSPPHPSYTARKNTPTHINNSVHPLRLSSRSTFDPWSEIPRLRAEAPARRTSTRTILQNSKHVDKS
ncbi:mitogen-activated protein kinase kinase kinase 3-like isoform X1 [Primulina eburnea]|uniref:mitogen-activated protein kinase kinase kinase 3-like isoform X1 n=2 Tax=Primulina eburnea TaxID=1245227 RepID=UPI003C6C9D1A